MSAGINTLFLAACREKYWLAQEGDTDTNGEEKMHKKAVGKNAPDMPHKAQA